MSIVLGINTDHPGSSAALVVNGKPVFAIAEERLNRKKYYADFPYLAIKAALEYSNISEKEITHVAVGRDSSANMSKKLQHLLTNPSKLLNFARLRSNRSQRIFSVEDRLKDRWALNPQVEFVNVEHHLAHISSSYYLSGWNEASAISIDGSGDFVTVMMASCQDQSIDVKKRIYVPESLGWFYSMVCQFIGYDKYGDEGKVMGLAPLGEDVYRGFFEDLIYLTDEGFRLNPLYFKRFEESGGLVLNENGQMDMPIFYTDLMIQKFGAPRVRGAEITKRDMDLAFGLQNMFEKVYMHLLHLLYEISPSDRLVMSGGVVLNSVANGKLFSETPFKETYIHPAAGDDGLALGSAMYVSQNILNEERPERALDAYYGTSYSDDEIQSVLDKNQVEYTYCNRELLLNKTCEQLVAGSVIGWFQGRDEWGPRALGARSIIAHPGLKDMKKTLNSRIKHREEFRPFAPAILEEFQNEVFEHDHPSPFMLHVYKIRDEWRERIPAVNHVDDTGRLQTVKREENPLYYDLIRKFYGKTGIPIIINTSFNENEPIVCKPDEAIDCFLRTKMDILVIGSFFCSKSDFNTKNIAGLK